MPLLLTRKAMRINQEKFQTWAIVFLVFAINFLIFLIWRQNMAIANISRAVEGLSRNKAPMSAVTSIIAAEDAEKGFIDFFREFSAAATTRYPVAVEKAPLGTVELAQVRVDNCQPDADGVCGYTLMVYGEPDGDKRGVQAFYLAETAGGPISFYGPYSGDLRRVVDEAKAIKTLTEVQ